MKPTVGLVLLLAALVTLSYGPAYRAGLVWDDETILLSEPLHSADGLGRIWTEPRSLENEDHYWPLVYTTFWLEHALWGFAPRGYHVTNVVLHLLSCLLLWRILRRLRVPGAWLGAALWGVHPVHVESVAWVIERKDVLATACALGATLAWLRSRDAGARGSRGAYAAALVLFCAGLLSKTSIVTLPFALAVIVWWQQGALRRAELRSLAPFAILAVAAGVADLTYVRAGPSSSFDLSWLDRLLIASRAVWFYLGKIVWPQPLPVIYPRWAI